MAWNLGLRVGRLFRQLEEYARMNEIEFASRVSELQQEQNRQRFRLVDRVFMVLMLVQWIGGIIVALIVSPYTWIGEQELVHIHVWAVLSLGGLLSGMPAFMAWLLPGRTATRLVIAVSQALWGALLIHITGGRIETHFHIFGSLAFIAFYRDWRVLVTFASVVAIDHAVRGVLWPISVYGIVTESPFRWIEHTAWVGCELAVLLYSCYQEGKTDRRLCEQRVTLEQTKAGVEQEVRERYRELRSTKEFFQSVLDSINAHICVLDITGTILETNAVWNRFANSHEGDATCGIGANYLAVCRSAIGEHAREAHKIADGIEGVMHGVRESYVIEYPCHSPEEKNWYQLDVTPLQNHRRGAAVVVHTNITARVSATEKLAQTSRELQKAAREAGKAEVASSVLHNVGNVMNSLNVSVQLLTNLLAQTPTDRLERVCEILNEQSNVEEFLSQDPRGRLLPKTLEQLAGRLSQDRQKELEELEYILRQVDHIKHIIKKQQFLAKSQSSVTEEIRVEALVDDALQMNFQIIQKSGVQIERDFDNLPSVTTDKHRVLQILINLVANAIQATQQKGKDGTVTVSARQLDDNLHIKVADNGVGISSEHLDRIFQFGFTTKQDGNGFGLHSSAIEARVVGGELSATSDGKDKGAEFTLQLPVQHSSELLITS